MILTAVWLSLKALCSISLPFRDDTDSAATPREARASICASRCSKVTSSSKLSKTCFHSLSDILTVSRLQRGKHYILIYSANRVNLSLILLLQYYFFSFLVNTNLKSHCNHLEHTMLWIQNTTRHPPLPVFDNVPPCSWE